jgi:hypothetical protein
LAADGVSSTEIADRVGVSRPTVIDWRARYQRSGIAGLDDDPRSGRLDGWNDRCHPFVWTKTADPILTKVNRQNTSETAH